MNEELLTTGPITTAIAPWYGCNRMLAEAVGEELAGCNWVGVRFAGGMPELKHINASTIVVNDLHWKVINLAETIADPKLGPQFYRWVRRKAFHEATLAHAQIYLQELDKPEIVPDLDAARHYFVAVWMNRSAVAGTKRELKGNLPIRWDAGGGDSNKRYRSAVRSILAFKRILERCNFSMLDAFDFLDNVKDLPGHGLYDDTPFPVAGGQYEFNCGDTPAEQRAWHTRNRDALLPFEFVKIVCRFYDHPLIRELYDEERWHWRFLDGRDQHNSAKREVLLIRRNSAGRRPGDLF